MTQQNRSSASKAQDEAARAAPDAPGIVEGDEAEADESRTPPQFADEELFTVEQAAMYSNVPATTVRDWIETGMLAAQAQGSIQRVRRSDLERLGNPDQSAAQQFEAEHKAD